ncbi:MAG: 6-phosphofructokinase, partial [Eubacterium sp.]
MRVGILTSGGDCQGLNGAMYGLVKALNFNCKEKLEIYGILEGYTGLINGDYKKMKPEEFEGILNMGGSILGNSRQPFKRINDADENGVTKVQSMIKNYKNMDL